MSIEKITQLRAAEYSYNNPNIGETERLSMGVIAQDVDKIWPYEKYSLLHKDNDGNLHIEYHQLIAPMIKAIQELSDKVDKLQKELDK